MNKENVKKFWKDHNKTIKTMVKIIILPMPVIVGCVILNKILDKKTNSIFDKLEDNIKDEA